MVLVDVLEEHLDEAAFRWVQWERALVAPDFTLAQTAEREERLLAHLEGLEDADALDMVVRPAFDSDEAPRISAATQALRTGRESAGPPSCRTSSVPVTILRTSTITTRSFPAQAT